MIHYFTILLFQQSVKPTLSCYNKKCLTNLIIWNYIEQKYPQTKKWITDTPGFSYRNHHFYVNKCGFKIFHINDPKNRDSGEPLSGYCMEKIMDK